MGCLAPRLQVVARGTSRSWGGLQVPSFWNAEGAGRGSCWFEAGMLTVKFSCCSEGEGHRLSQVLGSSCPGAGGRLPPPPPPPRQAAGLQARPADRSPWEETSGSSGGAPSSQALQRALMVARPGLGGPGGHAGANLSPSTHPHRASPRAGRAKPCGPSPGAAAPSCWSLEPTTWPRGGPPPSEAPRGLELAGAWALRALRGGTGGGEAGPSPPSGAPPSPPRLHLHLHSSLGAFGSRPPAHPTVGRGLALPLSPLQSGHGPPPPPRRGRDGEGRLRAGGLLAKA